MDDKFLAWVGAATDPSGYGEATRNYLFGIDKIGEIPMRLMNKPFWHGDSLDLREKIKDINRLSKVEVPKDVDITMMFHLTPENYFASGKIKNFIGMTTFETDGVPAHWVLPMRAMDYIITYSDFNIETFRNAGINTDIIKVPHGVDVDKFNPDAPKMDAVVNMAKDRFVFGSNFEWSDRKNPKALLEAYYKAFTKKDDVILVLKTFHQFPIDKSAETIKSAIAKIKKECDAGDNAPPVAIITEMIRPDDMPSFYSALDCYVSPSRGEGWGLTYTEAMATGLCTIGTNWSANLEFMDSNNSLLIDADIVPIEKRNIQERPHYGGQKWAEIHVDKLADAMKYVYENQSEAEKYGNVARKDMCEKWTWKGACAQLNEELKRIM